MIDGISEEIIRFLIKQAGGTEKAKKAFQAEQRVKLALEMVSELSLSEKALFATRLVEEHQIFKSGLSISDRQTQTKKRARPQISIKKRKVRNHGNHNKPVRFDYLARQTKEEYLSLDQIMERYPTYNRDLTHAAILRALTKGFYKTESGAKYIIKASGTSDEPCYSVEAVKDKKKPRIQARPTVGEKFP